MGDCTVIDWVAVSRHITTVSGMCFKACEIHPAASCSINHENVVTDANNVGLSKRTGLIGTTCAKIEPEVWQRPPQFFDGYDPAPFLLQGDLWDDNFTAKQTVRHRVRVPPVR